MNYNASLVDQFTFVILLATLTALVPYAYSAAAQVMLLVNEPVGSLMGLFDGRLQVAGSMRGQRFALSRPEFSLTNAPFSGVTLADPPTAFTFDGAAAYSFRSTGTKLRAHVGNGYRVPSLYERFGTFFSTFGTPTFIALGDPFLKPEKTLAYDAGIEQDLARERLRLSATYFYTRINDIIGFGNVVPNIGPTARPFGGYENQKGGIARGGQGAAGTLDAAIQLGGFDRPGSPAG